jgi:hypothetical protein
LATYTKDITFFYSNPVERQTVVPVSEEAARRGYTTTLTDRPFQKAEIGLYCQHDCFPGNSRLSFVMLHDMGQGQCYWPNHWMHESWNDFDAGILPGEKWASRWRQCSYHPYTRPRHGVYALGWPKSDVIFTGQSEDLSGPARELRERLGLEHDISVLYAPAWENDNKQDEFVRVLMDLPVNLLLKQFPWTDEWPRMVEAVARVNALHRDISSNVHVVDPDVNIMHVLELADIVVSEESSVLIEALLLTRPAVSVSDWMIPDTCPPRLPAAPFDFLIRTTRKELRATIETIIQDLPDYTEASRTSRDQEFCYLGNASSRIMDLIDSVVEGRPPPFAALQPAHPSGGVPFRDRFRKYLRKLVYTVKHLLGIKRPLKKTIQEMMRSSAV